MTWPTDKRGNKRGSALRARSEASMIARQHLRQGMGHPPRLARILDLPEMIQKRFQARLRQALKKGNAHGRRLQITAATKSPPNEIVNRR
jgi:hypothetical protein